jgi:pimeloyl-ACP methyl ester carboxylesterase
LQYFACEEYFKNRFDSAPRAFAFKAASAAEYESWKAGFRERLAALLGLDRMRPCAPEPKSHGVELMDGYTREKMTIMTEPGVMMPFYILKPAPSAAGERLPVMLALHGHGSNGKSAVCGIDKGIPALREAIDKHNYAYGVDFAKKGWLTVCPDARGFGERAEKYERGAGDALKCSCYSLSKMALPFGMCVAGMWNWDLSRLLDYVLGRQDADGARVSCAGLSGGGMQALWLSAMDERVKSAVVSGYFYGYKNALLEQHECCYCNYVPGLFEAADMGDIGALSANRGLFVETGRYDELNGRDGLDNVYPQVETVKRAAAILGNEAGVRHHVFDGGHAWRGEQSVPWLCERSFLGGRA